MSYYNCICVESKMVTPSHAYGRFILGRYAAGQGLSVANGLRRGLLGLRNPVTIVGVRLANVAHEYECIPGLRECVLDVLLNLKQVVLRCNFEHHPPTTIRVAARGPTTLKAVDLRLPVGYACVNPDQVIATLSGQGCLNMQLIIHTGDSALRSSPMEDSPRALGSVPPTVQRRSSTGHARHGLQPRRSRVVPGFTHPKRPSKTAIRQFLHPQLKATPQGQRAILWDVPHAEPTSGLQRYSRNRRSARATANRGTTAIATRSYVGQILRSRTDLTKEQRLFLGILRVGFASSLRKAKAYGRFADHGNTPRFNYADWLHGGNWVGTWVRACPRNRQVIYTRWKLWARTHRLVQRLVRHWVYHRGKLKGHGYRPGSPRLRGHVDHAGHRRQRQNTYGSWESLQTGFVGTLGHRYFPLRRGAGPVTRVNSTIVAPHDRSERILMEVWTNGSLDPRVALGRAARAHLMLFLPLQPPVTIDRYESAYLHQFRLRRALHRQTPDLRRALLTLTAVGEGLPPTRTGTLRSILRFNRAAAQHVRRVARLRLDVNRLDTEARGYRKYVRRDHRRRDRAYGRWLKQRARRRGRHMRRAPSRRVAPVYRYVPRRRIERMTRILTDRLQRRWIPRRLMPVDLLSLDLPWRTATALKRAKLNTLRDLAVRPSVLQARKGLGEPDLIAIRRALKRFLRRHIVGATVRPEARAWVSMRRYTSQQVGPRLEDRLYAHQLSRLAPKLSTRRAHLLKLHRLLAAKSSVRNDSFSG